PGWKHASPSRTSPWRDRNGRRPRGNAPRPCPGRSPRRPSTSRSCSTGWCSTLGTSEVRPTIVLAGRSKPGQPEVPAGTEGRERMKRKLTFSPHGPFDEEEQTIIRQVVRRVEAANKPHAKSLLELVAKNIHQLQRLGEVLDAYPSVFADQAVGSTRRTLVS